MGGTGADAETGVEEGAGTGAEADTGASTGAEAEAETGAEGTGSIWLRIDAFKAFLRACASCNRHSLMFKNRTILSSVPPSQLYHPVKCTTLSSVPPCQVYHPVKYTTLSSIPPCQVYHPVKYYTLIVVR